MIKKKFTAFILCGGKGTSIILIKIKNSKTFSKN